MAKRKNAKNNDSELFSTMDELLNVNSEMFGDVSNSNCQKNTQKKNYFKKLKKEMKLLGNKSDKDYSKAMLRKMAEKGVIIIEILEREIKVDPYARDAEVIGQLIGQVVNIIDKINFINREEKKIKLSRDKLELQHKKWQGILPGMDQKNGNVVNNIIAVGSTTDLLELIKKSGDLIPEIPVKEEIESINVDSEVISEENK